jgi:hypothetical protein
MKTLPARPHEKADGSVAAFIPRKNPAREIPRDFELGVSTLLGHYRNYSFNLVDREILTMGEGFNTQVFTQSFNTMVREILTLGEGFNTQVITLSPLPIAYKLVWHTLYGVSTWCSSEEHSHPIHHKNAHAYPSGHESTSIYDRVPSSGTAVAPNHFFPHA